MSERTPGELRSPADSGLRLRSSAKLCKESSPAFLPADRISMNDEHGGGAATTRTTKFIARHTIVSLLLGFTLGMVFTIGSVWFFKEGRLPGGVMGGDIGGHDIGGRAGAGVVVIQTGRTEDIRTQSAERTDLSTARRVVESESAIAKAATGEEERPAAAEEVVVVRSSTATEAEKIKEGGDNAGKEMVLHSDSVARLAENVRNGIRISSSHLLPSTHLLQPLPTDDLALFQTLSFNMLATQQSGLNALEKLYNRLKTIRLLHVRSSCIV